MRSATSGGREGTIQLRSTNAGPSAAVSQAESLENIFEANIDRVFGFLLSRCGSREMAGDIASETFAEAARVFRDGRGDTVTQAWLIHVARLRLIDSWRRRERHRRRLARLSLVRTPTSDGPGDQDGTEVYAALDRLTDRHRMVLVLRYLEDYPVNRVSETLGISYQATESLLARARKSFGRAYEKVSEQ